MAQNKVFGGISALFGDIGRARNAAMIYEDLNRFSDDALKARGLTREGIASHAFNAAFRK